ncbi:hypothetical protein FJZ31_22250 [Candidatus Poribacteria bacterium]|nr:hypothetical protein [Candidatus Poribacteria bacterium]
MSKHSSKWQKIIWREWRNCDDKEYANRLFDLVADEPAGWKPMATIVFLCALYGAMAGLPVGILATNWEVWNELWEGRNELEWSVMWTGLQAFLWWGLGIGAAVGLMVRLCAGRRLTWRTWLARLSYQQDFLSVPCCGLGCGMFFGLGVVGAAVGGLVKELDNMLAVRGLVAEVFFGAVVVLFFGVVGLVVVLLFMVVGLDYYAPFFMVVGPVYGLFYGLFFGLVAWVGVGLSVGMVAGPDSELVLGMSVLLLIVLWAPFALQIVIFHVYGCWSWCFWWRGRPHPFETEEALCIAAREEWIEPLHLLEERKKQPGSPDSLIANLQSGYWLERFTARHALVVLGGEAVEPLRRIAQGKTELRCTAVWLLKSIAQDTTSRLKRQAPRLLCPQHLVRYHANKVRVSWRVSFTYYGCRVCGQSREFLDWPGKVVAVLDGVMSDERVQEDGVLRVNWLVRRALFDFDQVEVRQATDEQVERFAVQVGNDTDEFRRPRYNKMRCVVASVCHLSENTIRILRSRFGEVIFND